MQKSAWTSQTKKQWELCSVLFTFANLLANKLDQQVGPTKILSADTSTQQKNLS